MTRLGLTSLVPPLVLVLGATAACSDPSPAPIPSTTQPTDPTSQPTPSESPGESPGESPSDPGSKGDDAKRPDAVGTLVDRLEVPWGVDFLPDGAAVVTERMTGRVLRVEPDGALGQLGAITTAVPQWLAIACVVAASIGATRSGATPGEKPGEHEHRPGTLAT